MYVPEVEAPEEKWVISDGAGQREHLLGRGESGARGTGWWGKRRRCKLTILTAVHLFPTIGRLSRIPAPCD